MKTVRYFVLLLIAVIFFSSCIVHKADMASTHYKNGASGKYFMHGAGYGYVHTRPPID